MKISGERYFPRGGGKGLRNEWHFLIKLRLARVAQVGPEIRQREIQ
jgi:hypothetical protein